MKTLSVETAPWCTGQLISLTCMLGCGRGDQRGRADGWAIEDSVRSYSQFLLEALSLADSMANLVKCTHTQLCFF